MEAYVAVVRVMVAAVVTSLRLKGRQIEGTRRDTEKRQNGQGGFVIFLTDRYLNEEQKVVS